MMENEDSVVTSLNELRKLKHERITRQTQSRAVVGAGRAAALAIDPASDQMTPPPALVPSLAPARPAPFTQVPGAQGGFPGAGGFAAAPAPFSMAPVPPPIIQTKTSYKAAVVVTALFLGAGGVGYVKLQNDTQALLAAKDASVKRAEEERLQAAGLAAKAEAQVRNNLRQCEDKLKAATTAAAVAPAVTVPVAPAVENKTEKPAAPKVAARPVRSKPAARPSRHAQAEPAAPKTGDVPNIAKKKKLDNDPLAGLGKL